MYLIYSICFIASALLYLFYDKIILPIQKDKFYVESDNYYENFNNLCDRIEQSNKIKDVKKLCSIIHDFEISNKDQSTIEDDIQILITMIDEKYYELKFNNKNKYYAIKTSNQN
jgi:hypothetical protein